MLPRAGSHRLAPCDPPCRPPRCAAPMTAPSARGSCPSPIPRPPATKCQPVCPLAALLAPPIPSL
eukprot:26160-Eustigmatos_ZCMA.PRE.1